MIIMFEIKKFSVSVDDKEIISSMDLKMEDGQTHVIMGPNGAGKSTFAKALLGYPALSVSGQVLVDGEDVTSLPTDERARKGLFLAFQNPEEVEGVKVGKFIRRAKAARSEEKQGIDKMMEERKELEADARAVGMSPDFVRRELNVGFSGGEKKRMEMVQALSLKPKVIVLEEIDSGLDVDGVRLIAESLEKMKDGKRCFLLITHYPRMLRHLKADRVHIMVGGKLVQSGGSELAHEIEEKGYSEWVK